MKYVPFVAQVESWKKSFATDGGPKHLGNKRRWIVNQKGKGEEEGIIQLVTPTQQAVERAQSEIKEMRKRGAPVSTFRPKVSKKVKKKSKLPKF
ncbi:MAG: hypothetical protein N0E59_20980 [Candidatus Thiodiazotropha taylori]|nr:hypothetical protein [Candidatus Thiodiazotropha taylori]